MSALDVDAAAFLAELQQMMPTPVHRMGVQAGRDMRLAGHAPAGPQLPHVSDFTVPGPAGPIRVRLYNPRPDPDPQLPLLMYLHGGGWSIGSVEGVDAVCRTLSEQARCLVASVDYRQAPEHPFPEPLDDVYAALTWIAAHAQLIGADPRRLAIGGDSAGANLAAAATIQARDLDGPQLCFQLLVYPPTERDVLRPSVEQFAHAPVLTAADVEWFWDLYVPGSVNRNDPRATPKNTPSLTGLPPTGVLTAEQDPIRDDGEDYARLLKAAGVPTESIRYTGVYHGFFPLVGILGKADRAAADAARLLRSAFASDDPTGPRT